MPPAPLTGFLLYTIACYCSFVRYSQFVFVQIVCTICVPYCVFPTATVVMVCSGYLGYKAPIIVLIPLLLFAPCFTVQLCFGCVLRYLWLTVCVLSSFDVYESVSVLNNSATKRKCDVSLLADKI